MAAAYLDRAAGALLATAAGDALGAGYEFGPPLPASTPITMTGGGRFGLAPGEWTDDTAMAIAIAEVAATGADLRADVAQDAIVARWYEWSRTASDVGNQTRAVLDAVGSGGVGSGGAGSGSAASARRESAALHERTGHTAGNGSLMRTAPVALAYLDDEDALVAAAAEISALTHFDPEAGEACVLWCLAIRHAVLTGSLGLRAGLIRLDDVRRAVWVRRITDAEAMRPRDFPNNGWVVAALQGAWSAITSGRGQLQASVENAVRGGNDTDTVAAIAGSLLGAVHGAGAIPSQWRRELHGWPGLDADGLVALATAILR